MIDSDREHLLEGWERAIGRASNWVVPPKER
jgi:hypothetical protein